ncbi:hypothetical protein M3231_12150 [Neobacillus mesonae]|nr:hypothetical protein [Neobacillus mesonae]
MSSKLVFVEGLPGFGKTVTAQIVHEILREMNRTSQLFLEGNLEHPADYDGVACFNKKEFDNLINSYHEYSDLLNHLVIKQGNDYLLEYRKYESNIPPELRHEIFKNDVYELPLEQNRKLITEKWKQFIEGAFDGSDIFIFDCCFIQNPVTMGMIKCDARKEDIISYVQELASIVEKLDPLLIYIEQNDLNYSFRKAVKERPLDWSEGFIQYYTQQGYGKRQGYNGLEGTLHVLKKRREMEEELFNSLSIAKKKVNNSSYEKDDYKQLLKQILSAYF